MGSNTGSECKESDIQTAQDLTNFVKTLLDQINDRFKTMTDGIVHRIDEMTDRIDDLEKTVCQLVQESCTDDNVGDLDNKNSKNHSKVDHEDK